MPKIVKNIKAGKNTV